MMPGDWQAFGREILMAIIDAYKGKEVAIPSLPSKKSRKATNRTESQVELKEEIEKKLGIIGQPKVETSSKVHFRVPNPDIKARLRGSKKIEAIDSP